MKKDKLRRLRNRAMCYVNQGRFKKAEFLLKGVVDIGTASAGVLSDYAYCLLRKGELEQADDMIRRALELDPDSADSWLVMGLVLSKYQQFGRTLWCFEQALELTEDRKNIEERITTFLTSESLQDGLLAELMKGIDNKKK